MGAVVLAEDTQLARQVALKIPFLKKASGARTLRRFEREAKAAASLSHPNLCAVYDFGTFQNYPFLSMAYIAGKPLQAFLDSKTPIPQRTAAGIIKKIAQALEHAHERGVIHRDLKPSNIMIEPKLGPIVTDFGLARCLDEDGDSPLTQDGVAIGTPSYMSPEQLDGDFAQMGPGSDIFSLGLILYEMLTGQRRFQGKVTGIIGQILTRDPTPLREIREDIDPQLDLICQKMMARNPAERYASMAEVADVMRAYLKGELATRPRAGDLSLSDPEVFFLGLPAGEDSVSLAPSTSSGAAFLRTEEELVPPIVISEEDSHASRILTYRSNRRRLKTWTFAACLAAGILGFVLFGPMSDEPALEDDADALLAADDSPQRSDPFAPQNQSSKVGELSLSQPPAVAERGSVPIPWRVEKILSDIGRPLPSETPAPDAKPPASAVPPPASNPPPPESDPPVKLNLVKGKLEFHAVVDKTINGHATKKKYTTPRSILSELAQLERRQNENDKSLEHLKMVVVLNANTFEFLQAKPARQLASALDEAFPQNIQIEEVLAKLEYLNPELVERPPASLSPKESQRIAGEVQTLFLVRFQQLQTHLLLGRVSHPQEEIDKAQAVFEQECRKIKGIPKGYPLPKFRVRISPSSAGSSRYYVGDTERHKEQNLRGQIIKRIAEALNAGKLVTSEVD